MLVSWRKGSAEETIIDARSAVNASPESKEDEDLGQSLTVAHLEAETDYTMDKINELREASTHRNRHSVACKVIKISGCYIIRYFMPPALLCHPPACFGVLE